MKEFVMIFRIDALPEISYSPVEMQELMNHWKNWIGNIDTQHKLVSRGNRLGSAGRVIKAGIVVNGPYIMINEIVGGYIIVRADSINDATDLVKGCPIITSGAGCVEVRDVARMVN
ncbi:MAG: YciI family protein [Mucilaginibacter sp.]